MTDQPQLAGFTYCALAALALLEHSSFTRITVFKLPAISNPGQTINWLLKRQTAQPDCPSLNGQQPSEEQTPRSSSPKPGHRTPGSAGFNGRCGKSADTCYSFWVGASLLVRRVPHPPAQLNYVDLIDCRFWTPGNEATVLWTSDFSWKGRNILSGASASCQRTSQIYCTAISAW